MTDGRAGRLGLAGHAALNAPEAASRPDAPSGSGAARSRILSAVLLWGLVAATGALLGAGVLLWVRNGSAVFFDIMSSGVASCM